MGEPRTVALPEERQAEERQRGSAMVVPVLAVAEEGQAEERRRWSAKLARPWRCAAQ